MANSTRSIGFACLGAIGIKILESIATKSQASIYVFDRDAQKCRDASAYGARPVGSLHEVATKATVIASHSLDPNGLEGICCGREGLLAHIKAGQTFIDFGLSPLMLTRVLAAEFELCGATYLDAPVSAFSDDPGCSLRVFVGSSPETLADIAPILNLISGSVLHCGPVGCGQLVCLLRDIVILGDEAILAEAVSIGASMGITDALVIETLRQSHNSSSRSCNLFGSALPSSYMLQQLNRATQLWRNCGVDPIHIESLSSVVAEAAGTPSLFQDDLRSNR